MKFNDWIVREKCELDLTFLGFLQSLKCNLFFSQIIFQTLIQTQHYILQM